MKQEPVSGIQPAVLKWARLSLGLAVCDVARKLKREETEIEEWESGSSAPTYPQLEKLAYEIYKRPLAVFFLPAPPQETTPAKEFRSLPDADLQQLLPDTHLHIRRAHAFQLALSELFGGQNPAAQPIWNNIKLQTDNAIIVQAEKIRHALGISLKDQIKWKDDDLALKQWRLALENAGIFVFKDSFKQKAISGFCLSHDSFPVVYLNNSTTKTRQIFSLMHELSHLLLSINGISKFDKSYINDLSQNEKTIEQFCNAISAEILIPIADFNEQTKCLEDIEHLDESVFAELARRYGVSREAILRRFFDQGRVGQKCYEEKSEYWKGQQKRGGSGNYYATQNTYLSERFAKEVVTRYYRRQLSVEQASDLLGIKPKNFPGLEQRIMQGGAA
ncbi:ImmA/IrrE family metallo-endopeptidase [Geobacter argillaceus]|uniref:Zn-dependent peptidase ImmA (M78 family) n=1 Tax=Geobacter argillaceus TaxID=345631 RepID=A0A562V5H1_9BACT|nr:ImmA/IrrE family metallo-endopeptidase [Geobacter argillaceus]TWJ13123.1 Zn-dependent peptidase ImmA (M78 family) [Geobacter argillaceus]